MRVLLAKNILNEYGGPARVALKYLICNGHERQIRHFPKFSCTSGRAFKFSAAMHTYTDMAGVLIYTINNYQKANKNIENINHQLLYSSRARESQSKVREEEALPREPGPSPKFMVGTSCANS